MSDLPMILQFLSGESSVLTTKRFLVIELSEAGQYASRLAPLLLRPSRIWGWAVAETAKESSTWGNIWRTAISAPTTPQDVEDLKVLGKTPGIGGRSPIDLKPDLCREIRQLVASTPDFILPIGALCKMKAFGESLAECFPTAKLLEPHTALHLPNSLNRAELQKEIETAYPPKMDADYFLDTATLDEKKGKLLLVPALIVNKDTPPPTARTFCGRKLFRAIGATGTTPSPVNIIIHKGKQTVIAQRVTPPLNVFYLQWWVNYSNDQLGVRVVDDRDPAKQKTIPGIEIPKDEVEQSAVLPDVRAVRSLDIAFIVDGTLRNLVTEGQWIPSIEIAKKFISEIVQALQTDPSLDLHCALCLYGDWPHSGQSDYVIRAWSLQPIAKFQRLIEQESGICATEDQDYEALLEVALRWANPANPKSPVQWRQNTYKCVVVIGYAPPHPPNTQNVYDPAYEFSYAKYGFTHEPFTSPFNWLDELSQMRQMGVQVVAVWEPYDDLERKRRTTRYSYEVWRKLGDGEHFFIGLDTHEQVAQAITERLKKKYIAAGPVPLPLTAQIHSLRCEV